MKGIISKECDMCGGALTKCHGALYGPPIGEMQVCEMTNLCKNCYLVLINRITSLYLKLKKK